MEEAVRFVAKEAAAHGTRHLLWGLLIAPVLGMLGVLLFGRNYKKRIADLEARPAITQVFNFDPNVSDQRGELLQAAEKETLTGLKEVVTSLTQNPLGNGNTYAKLPPGTNIVTMADGSIRLALPVYSEGIGATEVGGSARKIEASSDKPTLTVEPDVVEGKPKV